MGLSFWYHRQQEKETISKIEDGKVEMPSEQRTRFFREQLSLGPDQLETFRELNRDYNRNARNISYQLENLRVEMVEEMGEKNPNPEKLRDISQNIGQLHSELKDLTIKYYLDMKEACDENQQEKLNEIFLSMSKAKEDVSLPQRGRGNRGNRNNL
jgi:hypothetical protein